MQNRKTILATLFVAVGLLAISPAARAITPPPDGGYPGGNTAEGQNALLNLTTGTYNTAFGWRSLRSNITGGLNTGVGAGTLFASTGDENTAIGGAALFSNTTGDQNTATGALSLFHNTSGSYNTATGAQALFSNTDGALNTATGAFALSSNSSGSDNTAMGLSALLHNNGDKNTAMGDGALLSNTTGSDNTAIGFHAGSDATSGSNNVYIGSGIGGVAGESNACYIASIFDSTSANGAPVFINSSNKLGVATSSKRFKNDIKPMDKASETIFALKPVTFRYKGNLDPKGTPQFGLVAEDVQNVSPALVVRDNEGKPYSVRYDQVNAMLLNEFLKEHRKVEKLEGTVTRLAAMLKKQASQIQRVSARVEPGNSPWQLVVSDR